MNCVFDYPPTYLQTDTSLHVARRRIRDEMLIQKFLNSTLVRNVTKPVRAGVYFD